MAYIDTKYLFQCETCRHHLSGKCDTWCDHGEEYIPLMTKIPTADVVEVKHGEWYLLDECSNEGVYCSVCHKKVYKKDYANQKLKSPRCPNCGAYMDGGKADCSYGERKPQNDFKVGNNMIDIEKLLKSKHTKVCGNKYFRYSCTVENGISEPCSITICGKTFYIPHKLRKLLRHKERF